MAVVTADSLHVIDRDQGHVTHTMRRAGHGGRRRASSTAIRTTCSRKSSSSPRRFATRCAAGLSLDEATAVFGGLNLSPQQLRSRQPHSADRLRHELARGAGGRVPDRRPGADSGRSRIRQRAALSQSAAGQQHAAVRHHAKRRNGRHAGGAARNETQGAPDAGDLQRRGQLDRPGGRRRHLSARRARKSAWPRPRRLHRSA